MMQLKRSRSDGVELETEVREALLEEPAAEVVDGLAEDGRVALVEVPLLHLLELLGEEVVHQQRQLPSPAALAEFLAGLELVEPGVHVQREIVEELDAVLADVPLHLQQELAEHVVDRRGVGLVFVRFVLLLAFLPVLPDGLEVGLLLSGGLPAALLGLLVLEDEGEELGEVLLELLEVVGVLKLLRRVGLLLLLLVGRLIVLFAVGQFGELGLAVVLGLDVRVEGGVAEVGLAAVAGEVAAVLVVPRAPLTLEVLALVEVEAVGLRAQIRLAHRCTQILQQFELMLCFLGLRLHRPLAEKQKYKECLQELRHYLALRKAEISETDYVITAANQAFIFALPKNPLYLHTNFYNMPLFHSADYDFLDICYECLMILQEAFPLSVKIELVSDSESQELQAFEERKQEELNRRINSNLRALAENSSELTAQDVENTIFLIQHSYTRKNKAAALKLLASKATPANVAELSEEFLEVLARLQEEGDLRKAAGELLSRIRSLQGDSQREKENLMKASNLSCENKYGEGLKLQPLIFQLRESYNLERLCALLAHALNAEQEKDYYCKLESSIATITSKFLASEFEEAGRFGGEFYDLLKRFWGKRGKKWDEGIRSSLQNKIRSLGLNSRASANRSRVATSRNDC